jgi:hypothetical protein
MRYPVTCYSPRILIERLMRGGKFIALASVISVNCVLEVIHRTFLQTE